MITGIESYYVSRNEALHRVLDWCKVRSMIRALRRGESLPTVYVEGDGNGRNGNWLSGTHRVAASEIRAKLDGLNPYKDLHIFDISPWLEALSEEGREKFLEMDNEYRCDILDACGDEDEFVAAIEADDDEN